MSYVSLYSALMFVMIHKIIVRYDTSQNCCALCCQLRELIKTLRVSSYYLSKYDRKYEMLNKIRYCIQIIEISARAVTQFPRFNDCKFINYSLRSKYCDHLEIYIGIKTMRTIKLRGDIFTREAREWQWFLLW